MCYKVLIGHLVGDDVWDGEVGKSYCHDCCFLFVCFMSLSTHPVLCNSQMFHLDLANIKKG